MTFLGTIFYLEIQNFYDYFASLLGHAFDQIIFVKINCRKEKTMEVRNFFIVLLLTLPLLTQSAPLNQADTLQVSSKQPLTFKFNRFAFGVAFVPYYSGTTYLVQFDPLRSYGDNSLEWEVNQKSHSELQAAGQFNISKKIAIEFALTYNGNREKHNITYVETKEKRIGTTDSITTITNEFHDRIYDTRKLLIQLGLLYYFKRPQVKQASPFFFLEIGRSIAHPDKPLSSLNLPSKDYDVREKNNLKEFERDINSPWQLALGGGAEYFFNDALSLKAFIRWQFVNHRGTFKIIKEDDWTLIKKSYTNKIQWTEFETSAGIGFNFYF